MINAQKAFSSVAVDNIEKAAHFYGTTLGLKTNRLMGQLHIDIGGGKTVFLYEKPDHSPANYTVLNFPVDSVVQTVKDLKGKGVTFETYQNIAYATDENGIHRPTNRNDKNEDEPKAIAWFKDPSGNILSIVENG